MLRATGTGEPRGGEEEPGRRGEKGGLPSSSFLPPVERLHGLCRERGVRVIGDVPLYVSHDSADLWPPREIFDLDARGALQVAGVPPTTSGEGQRWGNLYRWDVWNGKVSTGGSKGSVTGWPCSTWSE